VSATAWIALGALVLSVLVALVIGPLRHELKECEHDRRDLRHRVAVVTAAIVSTLPRERRIQLLAQLEDHDDRAA
jgi:hypothetical protein